jgi:hypothetical protein
MEKPKMNLKMFEKEKLQVAQLLEAKGGSGGDGGTCSTCTISRSMGGDNDCLRGDCDY